MVTVLRAEGLRVVVFLNDHTPAHVHAFGDGEVKINLVGPDQARNWFGRTAPAEAKYAAPRASSSCIR